MNKSIRLNKRTLITFELPEIKLKYNTISLYFQNNLFLQYFPSEDESLFYNIDFQLCLLGFGISIETIVNKNKIDNIISSSQLYLDKLKQLSTKKIP